MEKEVINIAQSNFKEAPHKLSNSPISPVKYAFEELKKKGIEKSSSLEKRKKKIFRWFENKDNLAFFCLIAFAIIIRLYYFWITKSQALWWDEADYLAYAKTLAGMGTNWIVSPQHNSLFPHVVALFFKLGFSEILTKFIIEIVPSVLLVVLTYKICEKVYGNKSIALISAFVMAVFWNILFNSMRFHLGAPALLFAFLAIYSFFVGYEKREKIFWRINPNWAIPLAVVFTIISYAIRRNYAFFGIFFLIYMISTKKARVLIKDKYNWIALVMAAICLLITEKLIFIASLGGVANQYYHPELAFNFSHLTFMKLFFQGPTIWSSIFLWLAFLGLAVTVFRLILATDFIRKRGNLEIKFDFFLIISLVATMAYFIFVQRDTTIGEARWYFPVLLTSLIFVSKGIVFIYDQVKKYNKQIAIIIIVLLLAVGGYYQLQHADEIIKMKIPSYSGIMSAGLKINEIANPGDIIISGPVTQTAYYSEKVVVHFNDIANQSSEDNFQETLDYLEKNSSIKYIVISFTESGNPYWARNEAGEYTYDANGQIARLKWEIPFMDTFINFQTGEQKILQEKTYENITFTLVSIEEEVFIYEIARA